MKNRGINADYSHLNQDGKPKAHAGYYSAVSTIPKKTDLQGKIISRRKIVPGMRGRAHENFRHVMDKTAGKKIRTKKKSKKIF